MAYIFGSTAGSASASIAPSFPYVGSFANAAWWTVDPLTSVWMLAPQQTGTITDADDKASALGGYTWRNTANLTSADVNTTVANTLYAVGSTAGNYIFDPGATDAAPHRAQTRAFPRGGPIIYMMRVRSDDCTTVAGDKSAGILVTNASSALNGFYMLALRSGSNTLVYSAGTGFTGGSAFSAALITADIATGIWLAAAVCPDGSVEVYYQVSASSLAPTLGAMTLLGRKTSVFTPSTVGNLYVGFVLQRYSSPSGTNNWEVSCIAEYVSDLALLTAVQVPHCMVGRQSTRASTAIPIFTASIGASATYSDAEIIARLSASVSGSAAIRAYVQRGSSYAVPADGAAGWVTFSAGTFAGLATVGTGANLSVWLDAASTGGLQTAAFSPQAFGALGIA